MSSSKNSTSQNRDAGGWCKLLLLHEHEASSYSTDAFAEDVTQSRIHNSDVAKEQPWPDPKTSRPVLERISSPLLSSPLSSPLLSSPLLSSPLLSSHGVREHLMLLLTTCGLSAPNGVSHLISSHLISSLISHRLSLISLLTPQTRQKEGDPTHATERKTHRSGFLGKPSLPSTLRESSPAVAQR